MAIFIQKPWYKKQSGEHIYGAEWDGTSRTDWTRTDDAASFGAPNPYYAGMSGTPSSPFDNRLPWSGMVVEEDANAGKVVKIPKFWYKLEKLTGNGLKIQIADYAADGFSVSPAHMDRGDGAGERKVVKVGRYPCASDYTSKTGVMPIKNISRADARTSINSLGSNIWQFDYAMFWTIRLLYIVEFANWDSQAMIGDGNVSVYENNGSTDSMPYHTGTMVTPKTARGAGIQYRNIEAPWSNGQCFMDGIYLGNDTGETGNPSIYCIKNPSYFSDSSNGVKVGTRPASSGYITGYTVPNVNGYEYALIPVISGSGNGSTYITDYCGKNNNPVAMACAASAASGSDNGMFYTSYTYETSGIARGCRLMILP